jgi:hypothetical protein
MAPVAPNPALNPDAAPVVISVAFVFSSLMASFSFRGAQRRLALRWALPHILVRVRFLLP